MEKDNKQSSKKEAVMNIYLSIYDLTPFNDYPYWFGLEIFHSRIEDAFIFQSSIFINILKWIHISSLFQMRNRIAFNVRLSSQYSRLGKDKSGNQSNVYEKMNYFSLLVFSIHWYARTNKSSYWLSSLLRR